MSATIPAHTSIGSAQRQTEAHPRTVEVFELATRGRIACVELWQATSSAKTR